MWRQPQWEGTAPCLVVASRWVIVADDDGGDGDDGGDDDGDGDHYHDE